MVEFVRMGPGIGWLPNMIAKEDLEAGRLVSLQHIWPFFELKVVLLRMKNELSPKANEFWTAMTDSSENEPLFQVVSERAHSGL